MKNKITGFIVALFTLLSFANAKGQCSAKNSVSCPITVSFLESTTANCGPTCSSTNNITLSAGGVTSLPCSGCPTAGCKTIIITAINNIAISPAVTVGSASGPFSATGNIPSNGCGATSAYFESSTNRFIIQ